MSANTVRRRVEKFPASISKFVKNIPLITSERYSADELYIFIKGILKYLFTLNDADTRVCLSHEMAECKDGHNAAELLIEAAKRADKTPAEFLTDKLLSYGVAHKDVYTANNPLDKTSTHVADVYINNKKRNNNIQERFNGTIRAFLRPRRGIKKKTTMLIEGFMTYYNFIRPHSSMKGRTPARMAGIVINGTNEWETLIANTA